MNIKLITKALHTLSLLSDEDYDLLMKLRSLSESEREALVLVLEPQTAKKKSTKKSPTKSAAKSARASGMAQQLNKNLSQQREAALKDVTGDTECAYRFDSGSVCREPANAPLHHENHYLNYHPFVAPVATAASKSSRRSTLTESVANSETVEGTAGVAAHGASGGD